MLMLNQWEAVDPCPKNIPVLCYQSTLYIIDIAHPETGAYENAMILSLLELGEKKPTLIKTNHQVHQSHSQIVPL